MRYILTLAFLAANCVVFAQKKVVNEEINITKEREVSIPKATKLSEKVPPVKNDTKEKKMNYSFFDRKPTGIEESTFSPVISEPLENKANVKEEVEGFNNYLKVGVGNYGRIYAETYINSAQDRDLVYGLSVLHNSTRKGPVQGNKSAQSLTKIGLDGRYHQNTYELKLNAGYENRGYYFYGAEGELNPDYTRADLRQKLNIFNFAATIQNTKPKSVVDYKLTTGLYNLTDNYSASELDWGTDLSTSFSIYEDRVKALINAEAYVTQMSDNYPDSPTRRRNLFRVEPAFNFNFGSFSAKVGFKAVSQSDPYDDKVITKGYPSATLTYKMPSMIYLFAGIDGDIVRNTMRSLLTENMWLKEQVMVRNTFKNSDYFIGARGELFSGLSFNVKGSFGKYEDLYYFDRYDGVTFAPTNRPINVVKYDVVYDEKQINFANGSLELGYSGLEIWKPNLKFDYNHYSKGSYEKPIHRPSVVARFGNTITLTDRLVSSIDLYYIGGIFARDFDNFMGGSNVAPTFTKLKDIVDLNTEFTYLFTDHFAGFIKLNNILGKNYQRYNNYSQLGLNFLVGINIAL